MFRKKIILYFGFFLIALSSQSAFAASSNFHLEQANNNVRDTRSLINGFDTFVKNCVACHSAKLIRYSRIAQDLELTETQLEDYIFGEGVDKNSVILTKMDVSDAIGLFGIDPPDLSLTARVRGADWIYTFLKSYYADVTKKFQVDNHLFVGTAMPHVLGKYQGIQNEDGTSHIKGIMSETEYDTLIRDLVNFMDYIAEPIGPKRLELGVKVIVFLIFLLFFFYLLKREYWLDIKK